MRHEILDLGSVELVEHWGSDERIIESARMSTGKGFQGWGPIVTGLPCLPNGTPTGQPREPLPPYLAEVWRRRNKPDRIDSTNPYVEIREEPGDEKLLRYLWEHEHYTPFEMAGATFEIKAPIFVVREWHRHRTQSYNELSGRYTKIPDENYLPTLERIASGGQSSKQKQGGSERIPAADAIRFQTALKDAYRAAQAAYDLGLSLGVSRELARLSVPVARYTRFRASANLRNWIQFLRLRLSPDAQLEIRRYAEAVFHDIVRLFPQTGILVQGTLTARHGQTP